jgi:hypothetical protein
MGRSGDEGFIIVGDAGFTAGAYKLAALVPECHAALAATAASYLPPDPR